MAEKEAGFINSGAIFSACDWLLSQLGRCASVLHHPVHLLSGREVIPLSHTTHICWRDRNVLAIPLTEVWKAFGACKQVTIIRTMTKARQGTTTLQRDTKEKDSPIAKPTDHCTPVQSYGGNTDEKSTGLEHDVDGTIVVNKQGDLVICVEHESNAQAMTATFRVSVSVLRRASKYFQTLLEPGRFGEGAHVEASLKVLRERFASPAEAQSHELPLVRVSDLGRISSVRSIAPLCADFFHILHGNGALALPPLVNLANLAIVADRFDALDVVKSYVARRKFARTIDGKTTAKADALLSEEKVRQRLFVAAMLDYAPWVEKYSLRVVIRGWVGREVDVSGALWWDLPLRMEEELACRREYVLDTVQSLQGYFLGLYTSRERQCKLGYDSSGQCDSFQLGEMVRFFTRVGTLAFHGALLDTKSDVSAPFSGDVNFLLDTLRQVPEYQIDRNHAHCGIRTRLIPLLDLLHECLQHVGVCPACWSSNRVQHAWLDAKRPLKWKRGYDRLRTQCDGCGHADLRAMFIASERDWNA